MKKMISVFLLFILLATVSACSGKVVDSDDPNIGNWQAVSASMLGFEQDITDLFEKGASLELKADGKYNLVLDGERASGKWRYEDGGIILVIEGIDFTGNIDNGILTLTNMLDMGLDLVFEKEGGYAGVIRPTATEEPLSEPSDELSKVQQWWDGDWYGYWEPHSVTDDYNHLDDGRWDIYARVEMDVDDTGMIYLWEDGEDFATVSITVSEEGGSGDMGAAVSESGHYWAGDKIEHADWIIDPSLYSYENYMVIDGRYEDEDDEGFYYVIYLRPWGQLWDDLPEDERPPWYADWYLDYYTTPMIDAILDDHGSGYIHSELTDIVVTEKPVSPTPSAGMVTEAPASTASVMGDPIETSFELNGVTITATLPSQGWCAENTAFGYNFYQVSSCDDIYSNSPRIRINIKPDIQAFDVNFSSFTNLESIQNRTIGGIDLVGRTYEFVGMNWIEYIGMLDDAHAISVNSSKIDISSGEGSAVLDSIQFTLSR